MTDDLIAAPRPVLGVGRSGMDFGDDGHELRQGVIEEPLIGRAEVTFTAEILVADNSSILQASAPADGKMPANEAFIGEVLLRPGESTFRFVGRKFLYGCVHDIACSPFRLDEEIAAENIAGMLDDDILVASVLERAERMFAGNVIREDRIKIAYAQFCRAVFVPAVECSAQEFAVLFRCDGEIGNISRRGIKLHARDKLQEPDAEADEKIEYILGMFDVFGIQQS